MPPLSNESYRRPIEDQHVRWALYGGLAIASAVALRKVDEVMPLTGIEPLADLIQFCGNTVLFPSLLSHAKDVYKSIKAIRTN